MVSIVAGGDEGAAFDRLTPTRQRFVQHYVETGGKNATEAWCLATRSCSRAAAKVRAHFALKDPVVIAAIREVADKNLRAGVALAAATLLEIAGDKAMPPNVRRQAACDVLDRGGLLVKTVSEHRVIFEDRRNDSELMASIRKRAEALHIDPRALLGSDKQIVDAMFHEVEGGEDGAGQPEAAQQAA